jgi:hypothetical protein
MRFGVAVLVLAAAVQAEIIDRVAVSIGDTSVVTESDIRRQIRLTAFLNGEKPEYTAENKRRAADMLVEQALIRREIAAGTPEPAARGVSPDVLAVLKQRYPDDASYRRALAEYKLTDGEIQRHLEWQSRLLRFIDVRFRPGVQIPEAEMREYYENVFVPDWRGRNSGNPPSFEDVHPRIEDELLAQRANAALDRWLGQTRTQTRIIYKQEVFQ